METTEITPEYLAKLDAIHGQLTEVARAIQALPVVNTTDNAWTRVVEARFWISGRRSACDKKLAQVTPA